MEAKVFSSSLYLKPSSFVLTKPQQKTFTPIRAATDDKENTGSFETSEKNTSATTAKSAPTPLNIKYRPRSRKQARDSSTGGRRAPPLPPPKKEWESMTLAEKAVELYVGEKGLLFWLNKFAYASIFIIIGGWILFRFVGPSLGLYQLDTPPLAPESIFKGS